MNSNFNQLYPRSYLVLKYFSLEYLVHPLNSVMKRIPEFETWDQFYRAFLILNSIKRKEPIIPFLDILRTEIKIRKLLKEFTDDQSMDYELHIIQQRDKLLRQPFHKLLDTTFCASPLTRLGTSRYKWIHKESEAKYWTISRIISDSPTVQPYIIQSTIFEDELTGNKYIGFPLDEYEFYLLKLFQTPNKLIEVWDKFCSEFDCKTEEESMQLHSRTEDLINSLIFKTYIISINK